MVDFSNQTNNHRVLTTQEEIALLDDILMKIDPYLTNHRDIKDDDETAHPESGIWWLEQMGYDKTLWRKWLRTPSFSNRIKQTLNEIMIDGAVVATITQAQGLKGDLNIPNVMMYQNASTFLDKLPREKQETPGILTDGSVDNEALKELVSATGAEEVVSEIIQNNS